MVLPLKPAKFYGSSLPRPRIYTDVKFSDERVDSPTPVLDPLMSWANDAHWSMGGLSFNRLRLQGKIEGNVQKLRKEIEKRTQNSPSPVRKSKKIWGNRVDSPPPAPISKKRRQRVKIVDEDEEEEVDWDDEIETEIKEVKKKRRRLVRKLGDDFELVGNENGRSPLKDLSNGGGIHGVALRTRSRRSMVEVDGEEDGGNKSKGKKGGVENGKAGKIKKKIVSVSPSKGLSLSLVSANGSRCSPRLKKRLDYV